MRFGGARFLLVAFGRGSVARNISGSNTICDSNIIGRISASALIASATGSGGTCCNGHGRSVVAFVREKWLGAERWPKDNA